MYLFILKMGKKKSELQDTKSSEKESQGRTKIVYQKCQVCGCRKKENDMVSPDCCTECARKKGTNPNFGGTNINFSRRNYSNNKIGF